MSNWGDGYKEGYRDAARKLLAGNKLYNFLRQINKEKDGSPSKHAVANKCCGGVDAHAAGCRG